MNASTKNTHLVVMGVSGTGKTTVAQALAREFNLEFAEGDDLHPQANVDKMSAGIPLNDHDREPWLHTIAQWMTSEAQQGQNTVVSCSALKKQYRDILRSAAGRVVFVHLAGEKEIIAERMKHRQGHFMPVSLLDSQYETLEALTDDELGFVVDIAGTKNEVIADAVTGARTYLTAESGVVS